MMIFIKIKAMFYSALPIIYCTASAWYQQDLTEKKFYDITFHIISKLDSNKIEGVKSDLANLEKLTPRFKDNWNYTNALHKLNIVKGRLALRDNDVEKAKQFLIESGNAMFVQVNPDFTVGSPQLTTFGPNMSLAKELLERGETEAVLQYFKICRKVWSEKLDEWEGAIRKGEIPDFGGNLFY